MDTEIYYSELKINDCTVESVSTNNVGVVFVTHPLFPEGKTFERFEKTKKKIWYRHNLDNEFGFEVKADLGR